MVPLNVKCFVLLCHRNERRDSKFSVTGMMMRYTPMRGPGNYKIGLGKKVDGDMEDRAATQQAPHSFVIPRTSGMGNIALLPSTDQGAALQQAGSMASKGTGTAVLKISFPKDFGCIPGPGDSPSPTELPPHKEEFITVESPQRIEEQVQEVEESAHQLEEPQKHHRKRRQKKVKSEGGEKPKNTRQKRQKVVDESLQRRVDGNVPRKRGRPKLSEKKAEAAEARIAQEKPKPRRGRLPKHALEKQPVRKYRKRKSVDVEKLELETKGKISAAKKLKQPEGAAEQVTETVTQIEDETDICLGSKSASDDSEIEERQRIGLPQEDLEKWKTEMELVRKRKRVLTFAYEKPSLRDRPHIDYKHPEGILKKGETTPSAAKTSSKRVRFSVPGSGSRSPSPTKRSPDRSSKLLKPRLGASLKTYMIKPQDINTVKKEQRAQEEDRKKELLKEGSALKKKLSEAKIETVKKTVTSRHYGRSFRKALVKEGLRELQQAKKVKAKLEAAFPKKPKQGLIKKRKSRMDKNLPEKSPKRTLQNVSLKTVEKELKTATSEVSQETKPSATIKRTLPQRRQPKTQISIAEVIDYDHGLDSPIEEGDDYESFVLDFTMRHRQRRNSDKSDSPESTRPSLLSSLPSTSSKDVPYPSFKGDVELSEKEAQSKKRYGSSSTSSESSLPALSDTGEIVEYSDDEDTDRVYTLSYKRSPPDPSIKEDTKDSLFGDSGGSPKQCSVLSPGEKTESICVKSGETDADKSTLKTTDNGKNVQLSDGSSSHSQTVTKQTTLSLPQNRQEADVKKDVKSTMSGDASETRSHQSETPRANIWEIFGAALEDNR